MFRNGRHGFTLIEVLVVMAIAGLVATMAVPQVQRTLSSYRLSSSAQQLAAELGAASSLALSRVTSIELQVQGGSFQVIDTEDQDNPPRAARSLEPGITFLSTPIQPVRFYSRGHARSGGYQLENEYGVSITVSVLASGAVEVGDMVQSP